jgi:multidrug efflux pump subunit AcrA (membrane-fusion protein)
MTPTILRIALPLVLLAAGAGVFVKLGNPSPPESHSEEGLDRRPLVTTATVAVHDAGLDLVTDGLVVPYREITTSAVVPGTIVYKSPLCNEGSIVTAGTTLLRIDPRDYEFEVRRLKSVLNQGKVSLSELNVELESAELGVPLAERDLVLRQTQQKRLLDLRSARVVSADQLEGAERAVITSQNSLLLAQRQRDSHRTRKARLESAIEISLVQLEKVQLDLERTNVKMPVDGVIIEDHVEQDAYVQTGAALFSLEDTAKVEVRCNLRMEEMRWIWQQKVTTDSNLLAIEDGNSATPAPHRNHSLQATEVTVQFDLGGHIYTWEGKLDRYDGLGLDERTRMVPCRIVVDHPEVVRVDGKQTKVRGPRALVRGMYVHLVIHTKPKALLLQLPVRAVQPGGVVWCVRDGKLVRTPLTIAQSTDKLVLVDALGSGLQAGDRVVVSPLQTAFTGLEVREEAKQ